MASYLRIHSLGNLKSRQSRNLSNFCVYLLLMDLEKSSCLYLALKSLKIRFAHLIANIRSVSKVGPQSSSVNRDLCVWSVPMKSCTPWTSHAVYLYTCTCRGTCSHHRQEALSSCDTPNANVIFVPVDWSWKTVTYIAFQANRTRPIIDKEASFFLLTHLETNVYR